MDSDLMVSSYQANLGEGGPAGKAVGVVLDVWYWIPVRDGTTVEGSLVSKGPPTVVLLCHEMEDVRPCAFGASGGAVPQHGDEHDLGDGHTVWCQAAWTAGYGCAEYGANEVCCVVPELAVGLCWLGQPREFLQKALCLCALSDDFETGG